MNQPIVQTFKRYEKKYRLTTAQRAEFIRRVQPFMRPDDYGTYTIGSLYLDTPDFRLIRASLEKPVYKEKLRLRSYGVPQAEDTVFLELKKKFKMCIRDRCIMTRRTGWLWTVSTRRSYRWNCGNGPRRL